MGDRISKCPARNLLNQSRFAIFSTPSQQHKQNENSDRGMEARKTKKIEGSKPSGGNRFLLKVFSYLLYLCILTAIGEVLTWIYWEEPPFTSFVKGNHAVYHHVPPYFDHEQQGVMDMRAKRHTIAKRPGSKRIVFMGDSYAFGMGLEDSQTIPAYLERRLKKDFVESDIEILNYAFVSYAPIIHELLYKNVVQKLQPDLVFLFLDSFDIQEDHIYSKTAIYDDEGIATAVPFDDYHRRGLRHLELVRFVQYAVARMKYGKTHLPPDMRIERRREFFFEPEKFSPWIDESFKILSRINRQVSENGGRLVLVTYPNPLYLKDKSDFDEALKYIGAPFEFKRFETELPQVIQRRCKENGIECLNLWPEIRKWENSLGNSSKLSIFNNKDGHFTAQSCLKIAKLLESWLETQAFSDKNKDSTKAENPPLKND